MTYSYIACWRLERQTMYLHEVVQCSRANLGQVISQLYQLFMCDPWCRGEEGVEQARVEAGEKAVEAREAAVRPLRAELGRMRAALTDLQSAYSSEVAQARLLWISPRISVKDWM